MSYSIEYTFGQFGSTVLVVLPPSFLCTSSLGREWEAEIFFTAEQQLKYQCVINIIVILNAKHSTIPATKKKNNTIPDETRTVSTPYSILSMSCPGPLFANTFQLISNTFPVF